MEGWTWVGPDPIKLNKSNYTSQLSVHVFLRHDTCTCISPGKKLNLVTFLNQEIGCLIRKQIIWYLECIHFNSEQIVIR